MTYSVHNFLLPFVSNVNNLVLKENINLSKENIESHKQELRLLVVNVVHKAQARVQTRVGSILLLNLIVKWANVESTYLNPL